VRQVGDIRIERFHARYYAVTTEQSLALDRALGTLRAGALDAVLDEAVGPELARVWAVCIPEVTVEVTLGDGGVQAWTETWADAVAAAVRTALDGASVTAHGASVPAHGASVPAHGASVPAHGASWDAEVVVFATRGDALVDLVRRTALDDRRHLWAWHQSGLGTDVAAALRVEPLLVPGVLRDVGPELFGRVLAPAELVELAGRVASAAGPAGIATGALSTSDAASTAGLAALELRVDAPLAEAVAAAMASLPVEVRRWVADRGAAPVAGLEDLAVLAALTASPHLAGDPVFLTAVATALGGSAQTPAPAPAPATGPELMPALAPSSEIVPTSEDSDATVEPEAARGAAAPEGETTDWGGVWFLAHALHDLDLVAVSSAPELALLVATFTGAPYADLSVRMLCGLSDDDPFEPAADAAEPDPAALATLAIWVEERVYGRWEEQSDEPPVPWRRTASIHRHPGEIEVIFSLSDVDPVIRAAGLDLDPGWVRWLGVFVRFSYV